MPIEEFELYEKMLLKYLEAKAGAADGLTGEDM